jgi:superfamily I DNA/RNA helicase
VFTNINRAQLEAAGQGEDIGQVLPLERVMCHDEMLESTDAGAFQAKLWGMFSVTFPCLLTMPQIDRVRWHLFPEIRVAQKPLELESDENLRTAEVPDVVRVMDLQQEQLARSLGEGHRVIHGVAGSGKTMILGYRCQYLAKLLAKPILVLCYNVALAERLEYLVSRQGVAEKVVVRNFHKWCRDQLRLYHVPEPQAEDRAQFAAALVEAVVKAVRRNQIPRAQYGAVLIDEAHDFEAAWLSLVAQMVDPDTNSVLVLYDDAQNLYGATKRRKFSFAEVGIQARGRTTILRLNYRNTAEVLGVAYEFAREVLSPEEAEEDGIPVLSPESSGRHGELPDLVMLPSLEAEADHFVATASKLHAGGMAWGDMAVLYRNRFIAERFSERLKKAGIPCDWAGDGMRKRFRPDRKSVKLLTMHSSKGLEFALVVIPGLGYMPHAKEDPAAEARLLYVAMTRAIDRLILTAHRTTAFVDRLADAIGRVAIGSVVPGKREI